MAVAGGQWARSWKCPGNMELTMLGATGRTVPWAGYCKCGRKEAGEWAAAPFLSLLTVVAAVCKWGWSKWPWWLQTAAHEGLRHFMSTLSWGKHRRDVGHSHPAFCPQLIWRQNSADGSQHVHLWGAVAMGGVLLTVGHHSLHASSFVR